MVVTKFYSLLRHSYVFVADQRRFGWSVRDHGPEGRSTGYFLRQQVSVPREKQWNHRWR